MLFYGVVVAVVVAAGSVRTTGSVTGVVEEVSAGGVEEDVSTADGSGGGTHSPFTSTIAPLLDFTHIGCFVSSS